jgi:phage baseplate assembly protein V
MARVARKMLEPLKRRVQLMVSRAVVNLIKDTGKIQRVQVTMLADETADDVEHFQPFGFTSHPPAGSEAIVLSVGGNRDHPVAVVISERATRFRGPTDAGLAAGESAIYSSIGTRVHVKADGSIAVVPSEVGHVHLGADSAADAVALAADVKDRLDALQVAHDTHNHPTAPSGVVSVPHVLVGPLDDVAADKVKAT